MKHQAVVGNIGHFDNEIDMEGLMAVPDIVHNNVKPQVTSGSFRPRVTEPPTRSSC